MKADQRRSPIRKVCEPGILDDEPLCKWECDGTDLRVAQFRSRSDPRWYAILHPSTKEPGKWQLTSFDEKGPWGDVNRKTCAEAIQDEGLNYGWKLEHVVSKRHGHLAGARR